MTPSREWAEETQQHLADAAAAHEPTTDEARSDEALIEAAHRIVVDLRAALWLKDGDPNAFDDGTAIDALGKRLIRRTEEKEAAEDALEHARALLAPVASGMAELDSFLRHRR